MEEAVLVKQEIWINRSQEDEGVSNEADEKVLSISDPLGFSDIDIGNTFEQEQPVREIPYTDNYDYDYEGLQEIQTAADMSNEVVVKLENPSFETDETFVPRGKLEEHRKSAQRVKTKCYICTLCHVGLHDKDAFQYHLSTVHADRFQYPCRHCGKRFGSKPQRQKHETIHDEHRFEGEPKFSCGQCGQKYHLKGSLQTHVRKVHLGYKPPRRRSQGSILEHHSVGVRAPLKKKEIELYQCPHCDLKFPMRCLLKRHIIIHSDIRVFRCNICSTPIKSKKSLLTHIRKVHENQTSTTGRPERPRTMAGQPCPCTICGKVFLIPSQLKRHMWLHTDEKPFECSVCGYRTRFRCSLRSHMLRHEKNEMYTNKCRICGKTFNGFSEYRTHRLQTHKNIPYNNSDKEKAFGCVICSKPFFTKGAAAVCTVYGHDPSLLQQEMFKHKCCQCPPETFGFHNLMALRLHWASEHSHIALPVQYRAGMYDGNGVLKTDVMDDLPKVTIPKVSRELRDTGIPPPGTEPPLWIEFDLLAVDPIFLAKRKKVKKVTSGIRKCPECSIVLRPKTCLKRHLLKVHGLPSDGDTKPAFEVCSVCDMKVAVNFMKRHLGTHKAGHVDKWNPTCTGCQERFGSTNSLKIHKLNCHKDVNAEKKRLSVNINDLLAVRTLLGNKVLKVLASHNECMVDIAGNSRQRHQYPPMVVNVNDKGAVKNLLGHRELKVELYRLND